MGFTFFSNENVVGFFFRPKTAIRDTKLISLGFLMKKINVSIDHEPIYIFFFRCGLFYSDTGANDINT